MSKWKEPTPKKARRDERIGQRLHPFIYFRDEEAAEDSVDGDDEQLSVICARFNPEQGVATMLLSDGSKQNADTYVESEDGFVRACWANPEKEIMLEVVNDTLVDGKIMMQKPAAKKHKEEATCCPPT